MKYKTFGKIILFGSGETSDSGKVIFRKVISTFAQKQNVTILETPAGFQPNSHLVASEIAEIFRQSLGEFVNSVEIIPAKKKGADLSPENPALLDPLVQSDFILMGPGSPTYAVRQLADSLLWKTIIKQWQKGITLCFSSAGALACSKFTLPVYEIYKVGEELHWIDGLNIFGETGLSLTIITHWNNSEGGKDLDTRFCYMGMDRFNKLLKILPSKESIIGIDENTALVIDFVNSYFYLEGKGNATLIKNGKKLDFRTHKYYSLESIITNKLIVLKNPPLSADKISKPNSDLKTPIRVTKLPNELINLLKDRLKFKLEKNFSKADEIRKYFKSKGYEIRDNEKGQKVYRI